MSFIDHMDFDFYEDEYYSAVGGERRPDPRCRRCGATCYWVFGNGWRLHDRNGPHQCSEKKLHAKIANDFEVLP